MMMKRVIFTLLALCALCAAADSASASAASASAASASAASASSASAADPVSVSSAAGHRNAAHSRRDRLTILHTNDTHSHIDPERGGRDAGKGGVIERAAFIDSVRAADGRRNVLLLDAGDFEQGSSYFTILGGKVEIETLNAMRYDAVCLGNHEFDNGLDDLARRARKLKCDVLCANYDFSSFELGRYVRPYAIYRRGGLKIGVIGLLCDVRSVIPAETAAKLTFISPAEVVNKWASVLRDKKGCDLVIVLSHLGYGSGASKIKPSTAPPSESAASSNVAGGKAAPVPAMVPEADRDDCGLATLIRGVDIIVGGHSHTNLTEPTVVPDLDGKPVTIVQDYRWGAYVGQLTVSHGGQLFD